MTSPLLRLLIFSLTYYTTARAEWKFSSSHNINISETCESAVWSLSTLETTDPQLMALYWDSWGKPGDGILTGHTAFLGHYDECINLKNTAVGKTRFCIYSMEMENNALFNYVVDSPDDVCDSSDCPTNISSRIDITVGVCYPAQCSASEFAVVLSMMDVISINTMITNPISKKTNAFNIKLKSTSDSPAFCSTTDVEIDTVTIAVIVVCGVLMSLVVIGTTIDGILSFSKSPSKQSSAKVDSPDSDKDRTDNGKKSHYDHLFVVNIILAFSLYNSVPRLISTKQTPSTIKGINAIKLFFNFVIVMHHLHIVATYYFVLASQNSPQYLMAALSRRSFQPSLNPTFCVDAFLLASATLSSYLTFKDMDKHKKFRYVYFYFNRFFRLSPMYYLFTFMALKLFVHIGQGPVWFWLDYYTCPHTWWSNIFYISNMIPIYGICMATAWHISADMQLFILSPIFILLLYRSQYVGLAAVAVAMIASTITVGYVAATNGYWAAMYANPDYSKIAEQTSALYIQPYYRVNAYLTGIVLGYVLYKQYYIASLPIKNWLKRLIYLVLWSIAIYFCTTLTLFGTYEEFSNSHHFTDFENVVFLMFSGLAMSIGLSIIIYICNTGYGGMLGSFLSWPGWDPLARLMFGVTLIHIVVIYYIVGTLQSGLKYSDPIFAMMLVFVLVMSYCLSAVAAVCVELPVAKIVSLCFQLGGMEPRSKYSL